MPAIRTLLWIGPGRGLATSHVADAPRLDVTWVSDPEEALTVPAQQFDAALLEDEDPGRLIPSLRRLRQNPKFPPIVVRVEESDSDRIRELLASGAADVLLRRAGAAAEPDAELSDRLERLAARSSFAESQGLRALPDPKAPSFRGIAARSRSMNEVLALVERASGSMATVLLTGETGSGKEVLARAIHEGSARHGGAFVAVNCAAFPDTLLESELFGHKRGSFTGADRDKPGLFEMAHGGTLFLDEVGETSGPLQAKLLRALQEREIRPVGGETSKKVDVRVLTATNRDLRREASSGDFRDDLFYRLAVFPINVPPLRDRREDILFLAEHFLSRYGAREGKQHCRLSRAAEHLLLAYHWPGNVRELENEMQRALALAEAGEVIGPRLLSDRLTALLEPIRDGARPGETLRDALGRVEAWLIRQRLEKNGGRRAQTARQLGVTREGLYKKMKRLGIE